MAHVFRSADLPRSPEGTLRFEGAEYAADVSFFLIDSDPGHGPQSHRHPYAEVFVTASSTPAPASWRWPASMPGAPSSPSC